MGQFAFVTSVAVCFVPISPAILKAMFRRKETAERWRERGGKVR